MEYPGLCTEQTQQNLEEKIINFVLEKIAEIVCTVN